jgi:hypothetical protein
MKPGRTCPLHYHYAPEELARNTPLEADCIYVVGGLYGNRPALDAIFDLAAREPQPATLVFNGDFNWFNIDRAGFEEINRRVLAHVALRGNVETELAGDNAGAGCGCGYPDFVGDAEVERSNRIMELLRDTARAYPALSQNLGTLPMHATARVGAARVAIVHGDCESLAGWGLSQEALADEEHRTRVRRWFGQTRVNIIASSHSCLPVMMDFETARGRSAVVNNGAAGMPNIRDTRYGVITRIATRSSRHVRPLYATRIGDVHVEALPVHYDNDRWQQEFLANWPAGSPAHDSYCQRITRGPRYDLSQALRLHTQYPRAAFSASRLTGA